MSDILVELQETMGSDISIANAAWTSTYDKDRRIEKYDDSQKVESIVKMLAEERHGTPFESVIFRFWIRMPIFTDRQHMTHRIATHNGLSGRYRTVPTDVYTMPKDVYDICINAGLYSHMAEYEAIANASNYWYIRQIKGLKAALEINKISNIEFKRAREVLRGALPQANMTERTTIMNLRSFANYQKQRNNPKAQLEIQIVAKLMLEEVKKANIAPVAISELQKINWDI